MGTSEARALLTAEATSIQRLTRSIGRRHRLPEADLDDFVSRVWVHLMKNECRALRQYRGDASVLTYLHRVITRVLLDERNSQWGKWRPTAAARRAGPQAIERDRQAWRNRDPERRRIVRVVPLEGGADWIGPGSSPDHGIVTRDLRSKIEVLGAALASAIRELSAEDQLLLSLRYCGGASVASIAIRFGLDQKRLYRQYCALHAHLRRSLAARGFDQVSSLGIVGWSEEALPALLRAAPAFASRSGAGPLPRERHQPVSAVATS
jgi:RNA polymerase sigma factor (sigma-70 family)